MLGDWRKFMTRTWRKLCVVHHSKVGVLSRLAEEHSCYEALAARQDRDTRYPATDESGLLVPPAFHCATKRLELTPPK